MDRFHCEGSHTHVCVMYLNLFLFQTFKCTKHASNRIMLGHRVVVWYGGIPLMTPTYILNTPYYIPGYYCNVEKDLQIGDPSTVRTPYYIQGYYCNVEKDLQIGDPSTVRTPYYIQGYYCNVEKDLQIGDPSTVRTPYYIQGYYCNVEKDLQIGDPSTVRTPYYIPGCYCNMERPSNWGPLYSKDTILYPRLLL